MSRTAEQRKHAGQTLLSMRHAQMAAQTTRPQCAGNNEDNSSHDTGFKPCGLQVAWSWIRRSWFY